MALQAECQVGLELLRRTVAAFPGGSMRPLDLFTEDAPTLWLQDLGSGGRRLGIVNWNDEVETRPLSLRALTGRNWGRVTDFWSAEDVVHTGGEFQLALAPHELRLLILADPQ
jgi:hypothetical protein